MGHVGSPAPSWWFSTQEHRNDTHRSCRHPVVAADNSQRGESGGGTPTLTKEYKDQPLASTLDSGRSVAEVARRAGVREMTSAKGEEPKDNGRVPDKNLSETERVELEQLRAKPTSPCGWSVTSRKAATGSRGSRTGPLRSSTRSCSGEITSGRSGRATWLVNGPCRRRDSRWPR